VHKPDKQNAAYTAGGNELIASIDKKTESLMGFAAAHAAGLGLDTSGGFIDDFYVPRYRDKDKLARYRSTLKAGERQRRTAKKKQASRQRRQNRK
jgi:hypothetical protein